MSELPFDSFQAFLADSDTPDDEEIARELWRMLEAEAAVDIGDPSGLWRNIIEYGTEVLTDATVDILSNVEDPAIHSDWVLLRSGAQTADMTEQPLLRSPEPDAAEQRIAYAPAMIPREPAKDGQIVPTHVVQNAAYDYMASAESTDVDADHDLVTGQGEVVESWLLKQAETFELVSGEEREFPAGTWMTGIRFPEDQWASIKRGDKTGISVFGSKRSMTLERDAPPESVTDAADNTADMGEDIHLERQLTFPELVDLVGTLTPEGVTADAISEALGDLLDAADESMEDNPDHDEAEEETEADATRTDKGESVESATMSEDTEGRDIDAEVDALRESVDELRNAVTAVTEAEEVEESSGETDIAEALEIASTALAEALDADAAEMREQLKSLVNERDSEPSAEAEEAEMAESADATEDDGEMERSAKHKGSFDAEEATREEMVNERQEAGAVSGVGSYQDIADNWGEQA